MGNMIMLFKAKDIKTMYSSDGRIPLLPGFDNFEYARAVTLKHRFPTCGLISNKVTHLYPDQIILTNLFCFRRTGTQYGAWCSRT